MAVKKILTITKQEKALRTKSEPVVKINREIKALFKDLKDTMDDAGNAIGLAAPQIGILKRVFAVRLGMRGDDEDEGEAAATPNESAPEAADPALKDGQKDQPKRDMPPPVIMVNSEIVAHSDEIERGYDGCLSVPGMMGYTNRYARIQVRYLDEQGTPHDDWFEDWDARMIQHEQDHLDGIMFMDRLATLDDLYVLVREDDGKLVQVPYREAVQNARKATRDKGREFLRS